LPQGGDSGARDKRAAARSMGKNPPCGLSLSLLPIRVARGELLRLLVEPEPAADTGVAADADIVPCGRAAAWGVDADYPGPASIAAADACASCAASYSRYRVAARDGDDAAVRTASMAVAADARA